MDRCKRLVLFALTLGGCAPISASDRALDAHAAWDGDAGCDAEIGPGTLATPWSGQHTGAAVQPQSREPERIGRDETAAVHNRTTLDLIADATSIAIAEPMASPAPRPGPTVHTVRDLDPIARPAWQWSAPDGVQRSFRREHRHRRSRCGH